METKPTINGDNQSENLIASISDHIAKKINDEIRECNISNGD